MRAAVIWHESRAAEDCFDIINACSRQAEPATHAAEAKVQLLDKILRGK